MKIEILQTKPYNPYYTLTIYYMIGDADGNSQYSVEFDKLNPSIEKLLTSLIKLGGYYPEGHWGWMFDNEHYKLAIKDGVLTKEDVEAFKIEDEVIKSETEYYFLVYQGFGITYTDETGLIHPCNVIL